MRRRASTAADTGGEELEVEGREEVEGEEEEERKEREEAEWGREETTEGVLREVEEDERRERSLSAIALSSALPRLLSTACGLQMDAGWWESNGSPMTKTRSNSLRHPPHQSLLRGQGQP